MLTIRPSSDLRNKYPEISGICKSGEPVFLTVNGKGDTVLLSVEEYDRMFSENYLNAKLKEAADDMENGRIYTHEQVFSELRADLNRLRGQQQ